jgi:hypothetical protein
MATHRDIGKALESKCEDIKQPTKEEIEKLKAIKKKLVENETTIRK